MRELNFKEIDTVSGGHDTSNHTDHQRAAEDAARRSTGGVEHHCTQSGTNEKGAPTFECHPVQTQAASLGF